MAYIANKPVRFDRDYKIGEVIPECVIAPNMTRKLVEMGRILYADLPPESGAEEKPGELREDPQSGADSAGNVNTQASAETPPEGGDASPSGPDEDFGEPGVSEGAFVCEECGRTFKSQNALAAHSRSHKD